MIKITQLEQILNHVDSVNLKSEILGNLQETLKRGTGEYIKDILTMPINPQSVKMLVEEGSKIIVKSIEENKSKLDFNAIPQGYLLTTGFLNKYVAIGSFKTDISKGTTLFTKNEQLLKELHKYNAFEDVAKYDTVMEQMFGNSKKVLSFLEKGVPAIIRLDIDAVIGDEVSFKLTIPQFKTYDTPDFVLYPYIGFPLVAEQLITFINNIKVKTFQEDGKQEKDIRGVRIEQRDIIGTKVRRVAFNTDDVRRAYHRGSYKNMAQVKESARLLNARLNPENRSVEDEFKGFLDNCKWDCLKLYFKGYNLEASLYNPAYTGIRLERIISIQPCKLKDLDTTHYLIDYVSVRKLFKSRVNGWRLADYDAFNKIVDTSNCNNIAERKELVEKWAMDTPDATLYNTLKMKKELFESVRGNHKPIDVGLQDMYRQKPSAVKQLDFVDLEEDPLARKDQVQRLLTTGVCEMEVVAKTTGAMRLYKGTRNKRALQAVFSVKQLLEYSSSKDATELVIAAIKAGKVTTLQQFVRLLKQASLEDTVDYSNLVEPVTINDMLAIMSKDVNMGSNDRAVSRDNDYLVWFKDIEADKKRDYTRSIDTRNIVTLKHSPYVVKKRG